MKIAVITDDFKTISAHFGRAQHYVVFTVEGGKITGQETRSKANHNQFGDHEGSMHQSGEGHGSGPAAEQRHASMMDPIMDCEALLAGGMGMGAHNALTARGIHPILTDIQEIQPAVDAYLAGKIVDHMEWLH
ncbi:MAG: dinitrogenase iron-molybdenum cofactor biosynthesis protein [Chloroflexi bacterium]|nr:MAG: dinitrogenase iron-molybdenum cofactor biosynthesis protein [Chloroflexota bacterium]